MRSLLKVIHSLRGLDVCVPEEQMRAMWLGMLLIPLLFVGPRISMAEEFAGRLVRVDLDTVTLHGPDNKALVAQVEQGHRVLAAPFLGKWVRVDLRSDNGGCKAVGFRSPR